jgi:type I restriction enzyme S subunit
MDMEFITPSGWQLIDLGELVSPQSGARPSGGATEDSGEIPSLGGENIKSAGGIIYEPVKRVPESFFNQMRKGILQDEDVLINKDGANTGKVGLYFSSTYKKACINEHVFILRAISQKLTQKYLYYLLASEYGQRKVKDKISGSAQPGLGSRFLDGIFIAIPQSLAEQRAIADILSTVDEAIAQSEALVRKYQSIKQGLMSDLLTRGVDENGELRPTREEAPELYRETPLGWLPKEWEISDIEKRCHVEVGGTPSTFVPEYWNNGDVPWMSSGDVHMRKIFDVPGRITSKGLAASNAKLIRPPAVALALAGQGRTRGMVALTQIELCTNQSVALIKPTSNELITTFLFYDLEFRYDELRSISMGAGRAGLSKNIINKIAVPLPSFAEQRIIAHILETQNSVIEVENRKLEKLKLLKQGLMQDLLSGRVRVKV